MAAALRLADRVRGQPGVLHAGLPGARRPVANGAAARRQRRDDRDRQARLWLRQAAAGAVRELDVACGARRFRPFGRDTAAGVARGRRRAGQHAGAGGVRGAAILRHRRRARHPCGLRAADPDRTGHRPAGHGNGGDGGQRAELLARPGDGDRVRRRTVLAAGVGDGRQRLRPFLRVQRRTTCAIWCCR